MVGVCVVLINTISLDLKFVHLRPVVWLHGLILKTLVQRLAIVDPDCHRAFEFGASVAIGQFKSQTRDDQGLVRNVDEKYLLLVILFSRSSQGYLHIHYYLDLTRWCLHPFGFLRLQFRWQ